LEGIESSGDDPGYSGGKGADLPGADLSALRSDLQTLLDGGRLEHPAVIDVTEMPHGQRHPRIFARYARAASPVPHQLCDVRALATAVSAPAGALWRLAEPGRQLDANLIHLPAGQCVDTHTEPDLDVPLVVLAGQGTIGTAHGPQRLVEGALIWLPRGSTRRFAADANRGDDRAGLSYLTVHQRRPGMQIRRRSETTPQPQPTAGSASPDTGMQYGRLLPQRGEQ
jgi:quercetin dioxygenase-like cupin family protein